MSHDLSSNARQSVQASPKPFDDIEDLYIAQIVKAPGSIEIVKSPGSGQTETETLPAIFSGEMLLYGRIKDETFVVERLRRIALYGSPMEKRADDPIVTLSLAGPLAETVIQPPSPAGSIEYVPLQLHYADLSMRLPPLSESQDAVFPQVERIAASVTWEPADKADPSAVNLEVSLIADKQVVVTLGTVRTVILEPIVLRFQLAGSGSPKPAAAHHSLPTNCLPPPGGPCGPGLSTVTRLLPIKFVNFSTQFSLSTVETMCKTQLCGVPLVTGDCPPVAGGVCEVWRNKAALDLTIQSTIDNATAHTGYHEIDQTQETGPTGIQTLGYYYPNAPLIVVYLVDALLDRPGGGISHDCGQASAYSILDLNKMGANPYLLAHELGHVLGLYHPDESTKPYPGSWESVMKASGAFSPNPSANTLYNCRIFTAGMAGSPLNPIVTTTNINDCFRPDPVDHFIRDFPTDSGIEPSVPPSGEDHWSNSSIWNRRSNTSGNTSGNPQHEEPYCTDATNYLYVKLEYRTSLRDPVTVDLYLADPGVTPGHEYLTPLVSPNSIVFDPPPVPGLPSIASLSWSPLTALSGYPQACCVYALAHSADEPPPFADPLTVTFRDVFPLLGTDNDIAQRNLHVQACTTTKNMLLQTWLPWARMANPFKRTARARLEVDATQALGLRSLALEVNNKPGCKIKAGEQTSVTLSDALRPADHMILRFRATLPPNAPEGMTFPIHLRFIVNNKVVSGYTHLIRVVPLPEAVLQVLDHLYGALRDVGAGCRSKQAQDLAEKVKGIMLGERRATGQRGRRSVWRSKVRNLSKDVAALAKSLELNTDEPERKVVRQKLYKLSRQLLAPKNMPAAAVIEGIRDSADRIQEPAGHLARRLPAAPRQL